MDLQKKKQELEQQLQYQKQQYKRLGINIERLIGAIGIVEEQLSEQKPVDENKHEEQVKEE